jgi:hypothetical protein
MTPTQTTAQATLVRFEPGKLFPLGEPMTTLLLRLMLAADDVRSASILTLETSQRFALPAGGVQKRLLTGQFWYTVRLLCSHLNEAGNALRKLDSTVCQARVDGLLKGRPEAMEALKDLRTSFEGTDPKNTFIDKVRNWIGFHYQEAEIKRVFEKCLNLSLIEGAVIASDVGGLARFTITDQLAICLMVEASGEDLAGLATQSATLILENFPQRVAEEVLPLSRALTTLVDHLVDTLIQQRGHISTEEEVIEIPPLLQAARQASPVTAAGQSTCP